MADFVISHECKVMVNGTEVGVKGGSFTFAADIHDTSTTEVTNHGRSRTQGLRDVEISLNFFEDTDLTPHIAPLSLDPIDIIDEILVYKHRNDKDPYQFQNVKTDRFESNFTVGQPAEWSIHGYTADYVLPAD